MLQRVRGRAILALPLTIAAACARDADLVLRDFPAESTAERTGAIEAASLPSSYLGGRIAEMAADAGGSLYLTTQTPSQLLRLSPAGEVEWARRGDEKGRDPFKGPGLEVAASGGRALVVDPGARRVRVFEPSGEEGEELALEAAFEAAASASGEIFVYPSKDGFLLDVFDERLRYLRSIVPVPGEPSDVRSASCRLLPDGEDGVFVLWNPKRTVYRLGPEGERRGAFALEPPDLLSNLETRIERAEAIGRSRGFEATVYPFLDLAADREGNLAALYLFEERAEDGAAGAEPAYAGALYRFTPEGRALEIVRGLGAVSRVAFAPGGEILALDWKANTIVRYRTRRTVDSLAGRPGAPPASGGGRR